MQEDRVMSVEASHIISVLGEPGVGKTTLLQRFLETLSTWDPLHFGLICGRIYAPIVRSGKLFVLGSESKTARGVFAGTDAWSMSVSYDVAAFWQWCQAFHAPCTVLVEGDRISYPYFFATALHSGCCLSLVELQASPAILATRTLRRAYHPMWIQGTRTRFKHLCQHYAPLAPYYLLRSETEGHLSENLVFLRQLVERGHNGRS